MKAVHQVVHQAARTPACRPGCAACCIAPSISSAIPGMPDGKPAGVPCVQLDEALRCRLFGRPERPGCCSGLQASHEMCGEHRQQALVWLARLEQLTAPENIPQQAVGRNVARDAALV